MKAYIFLVLIVGISNVIGNPVSKQAASSNDKESPLSETSESEETYKEDTTLNNSEPDKNKIIETSEDTELSPNEVEDITQHGDSEVDIVIEENVTPLGDDKSDTQNDINIDDDYLTPNNGPVFDIPMDRIKYEIMETAAGFAPLPFFRKKHGSPPRRRFAIRRQYQRYPHAPYRRYPIYYPYYAFYRPSSLRFY